MRQARSQTNAFVRAAAAIAQNKLVMAALYDLFGKTLRVPTKLDREAKTALKAESSISDFNKYKNIVNKIHEILIIFMNIKKILPDYSMH